MGYVKLKDVCTINMGQSPDSNSYNENEQGVPFFQGNADFGEMYPITRKWCSNPAKLAMPMDILISVRAPIGAMNYAKEKCCIGRGLAALTPDTAKVESQYLFWLLKSKNVELNSKGTGSTFKAIGRKVLEETLVPNISLEKQTECTIILEKVYKIILLKKQKLNKFDELVKARFIEMFGDIQRQEKYHGIQLKKLCTTISGGTPSTKHPEYYMGDIPWITTVSLGTSHINGTNAKTFITQEAIYNSSTKIIESGNILFGTRVGVGKSSINDVDICTNQDIVALIGIDESRFNKLFIKNVLDNYQPYFNSIKKGATILGITSEDLKNVLIPDAPIALQKEYESFVEQVDKSKLAVQKSLDKTQQLFDSLMQEYFG